MLGVLCHDAGISSSPEGAGFTTPMITVHRHTQYVLQKLLKV